MHRSLQGVRVALELFDLGIEAGLRFGERFFACEQRFEAVLFFIEAVGFVEQLLNERLLAFLFFTQKCNRVRSLRGARHERSYLLLDLSKHDGRG